jgi:uncharacterized tellurite resistance protein B-like protein
MGSLDAIPTETAIIHSNRLLQMARALALILASAVISACGTPEDPARVALRERVKQDTRLSDEDLSLLIKETARGVEGKSVRIRTGTTLEELDVVQRDTVLGMLTNPAGVFDEGLRTEGDAVSRVINGPGEPWSFEIEATRRLWIDVDTFLPRRFEFTYFIAGLGDYSYDLVVEE